MLQSKFIISSNTPLAGDVWEMVLAGDTSAITAPGQFINIRLEGFYLRRPISVCDWDEEGLTILYKILGRGTEYMTGLQPGQSLDILSGLGNGYDMSLSGEAPLLVGGGVGIPPLYGLARRLRAQGRSVTAILGFNRGSDIFYAEKFRALGVNVIISTADGSVGVPGFVTDAMETAGTYSHLYTCGPEPMLRAVWERCASGGQFSFEERMGCGFGACMGCSCETKYGSKRICRDGPVLSKEEIVW